MLPFFAAQFCYAQERATSTAFSIGPELNIPQRSAYTIGYGVSANIETPVSGKISALVTAGYHQFSYKNLPLAGYRKPDADSFIPLKAGAKYYVDPKFYTQAEVGAVLNRDNANVGNLFAYSLGTGFLLNLGEGNGSMIDIGLRFEDWSKSSVQQFAIRVAYRLGF